MLLRASSTSRAKSSSTAGRFSTNLRHASPESLRGRDGGRSSAIGMPLRTISISSPAPTRFITAEKLRATSVALIRNMQRSYQINQTPRGLRELNPRETILAELSRNPGSALR